jgi:hypothetical protein
VTETYPKPCRRTNAHTPHDLCPGTAPEFPSERVEQVEPATRRDRTQCIYCGLFEYEPGWGCHGCGMAAPLDEVSPDAAAGLLTDRERIAAGDLSDACFCMGGAGPHPYHGTPR